LHIVAFKKYTLFGFFKIKSKGVNVRFFLYEFANLLLVPCHL